MSLRPVGLADVIKAFAALKPETDEARIAIARTLGFDYKPEPKVDPALETKSEEA